MIVDCVLTWKAPTTFKSCCFCLRWQKSATSNCCMPVIRRLDWDYCKLNIFVFPSTCSPTGPSSLSFKQTVAFLYKPSRQRNTFIGVELCLSNPTSTFLIAQENIWLTWRWVGDIQQVFLQRTEGWLVQQQFWGEQCQHPTVECTETKCLTFAELNLYVNVDFLVWWRTQNVKTNSKLYRWTVKAQTTWEGGWN